MVMEKLKLLPVHNHTLSPFTRFHQEDCDGCSFSSEKYIYGGYLCNELGCNTVFHSKCAESVPEINHYSHPNHPLKVVISSKQSCSLCRNSMNVGYSCSICDFILDLDCARKPIPPPPANFKVHDHPLQLMNPVEIEWSSFEKEKCKVCEISVYGTKSLYQCLPCNFLFHVKCVEFCPERYHSSHSKHPLKCHTFDTPYYADTKCLLCGEEFIEEVHHCDICNFSICGVCAKYPPPLEVVCLTTHEHTLHIVPRIIEFTCNACGTQGDRSPYFCLQCNFMIHRECIDLPRVININRHNHRISYTSHLGHDQNLTCGVCRKYVNGFYGGYSCSKCPSYVVHSRCATRYYVWDKIELEGTPEEAEEMEPFQVIDDLTIKHFSHDHNLKINRDGKILQESVLCEACVFQIYDEPFYSCEQCDFILHETCANLRRKKRHVASNIPFTLEIDSSKKNTYCWFCQRWFTGFKYISNNKTLDIRCGSFLEPFFHESHPHPLYYKFWKKSNFGARPEDHSLFILCCDECPFAMNFWWAFLPKKVMNKRYDDHPVFLSYGENNVSSIYWCDVCETKLDPETWFYTCDDCGTTLHVSCVVGDVSFNMPGSMVSLGNTKSIVVANTCIRRPNCFICGFKCLLPLILKLSKSNVDLYICSQSCNINHFKRSFLL